MHFGMESLKQHAEKKIGEAKEVSIKGKMDEVWRGFKGKGATIINKNQSDNRYKENQLSDNCRRKK